MRAQLRALVAELAPPRYVAVIGYLPYPEAVDDVDVPGEPYSFARLIDAQGAGDLATLR